MLSLYVHIPFCRERCLYCDFFLVTRRDHVDRFFDALAKETRARAELIRGRKIKAIHFGGGTPSIVPVSLISGWLEQVAGIADLAPEAEITVKHTPKISTSRRLMPCVPQGSTA